MSEKKLYLIEKNLKEMPKDKKKKWIDTMLDLSCSYEESLSRTSLDILHSKVNDTKQQTTK